MWFGPRGGRLFDEPLMDGHSVLLLLGFIACLASAFLLYSGTEKSRWPVVLAQIQSVEKRCEMTATYFTTRRRYGRTVVVGCDQVAQFLRDNAATDWVRAVVYSGTVRVSRGDQATSVVMALHPMKLGQEPKVGLQFHMLQNPTESTDVVYVDRDLSEFLGGLFAGGLGAFLLMVAFFWF